MSEMLMAIFLVYSTSGITSGKKVCRELKIAAILKMLMAIFLVYAPSGITSGKKVCRELKMAAILTILKY